MIVDPVMIGILGSVSVFILIFLGMHIAFAMMFVGFIGLYILCAFEPAVAATASTMWEVASFYPYTVIPLFVIMGSLAGSSGMTRDLYTSFDKWTRKVPGGLAVATIGACGAFAAVSGSSVATAAAMGTVALPEMERFKYDPKLSTGSVAAGGTLGFLIPPGIGFVVYGMLTEQSIGKLLISGVLPGLLLAGAYASICVLWAVLYPQAAPRDVEPVTWKEKLIALNGVKEPLFIFLFVIGGIYTGFFTPDEAGAIGATILLIVAAVKRKLTWPALFGSLTGSIRISVMVLMLVAGANVFSTFMALSTIPVQAANWVTSFDVSRYVILAMIILIYVILGCFLDAISMMVLTLPVVFPIVLALHFDPIWFGVVAVLMMEAGLITPPMGLNLFTVAGVAKGVRLETIIKGTAPFLGAIIVVAVILTIYPNIALVLPKMMGK
ncbi:TRAP transporter large permease [Desulfomonile tiedjei]|uniref:TRAP transporter, DctM subunit n=1 Tax=Desulfomonile tiedjei (strain ATCC 49306 / DSM 6799 / DCB-1) TaxID=706587 RepID=I4C0Q6_DESTA|nr:TRAP transporter large permease [Desulfomonile tiedjei]AFM23147.1 TRAP transporter, DctM subunit [Desulfomonile tiedjei DSM 6799]